MKKFLAIVIVGIVCAGCSDPSSARRALDNMGFTDIELSGWSPFAGCGENDTFVTRFKARGPTGNNVAGVVCSGWLKGATVRFY